MTRMLAAALAALCVSASLMSTAHGSIISGFLVGRQFAYVGKFCFSYKPTLSEVAGVRPPLTHTLGAALLLVVSTHECCATTSTLQHISGKIEANVDDLQVAIYDDEALFWNYILADPSCDCRCKLSPRHTKRVFNVTASTDDLDIPFKFEFDVHEHIRPRFWYVALARCVPGGDQYRPSFTQITQQDFDKYYFSSWYELHFTQADGSELPVQQRGLPLTYGVMAVLSAGMAIAQTISARAMRQSESFHPIVKLLTMVVAFFFAANSLLGLHYLALAANGVGVVFFYYAAKIVQVFVRVGTILLAMLVAKGWTITSVTLHGQETLSCVMVTFLGLYLSMAMWYLVWLDPASTLYIYESWPGVGICSIQLAVLGWFAVTLFETRELEESTSKRRFFLQVNAITSHGSSSFLHPADVVPRQIGALFGVYIAALPVTVLIAAFLSPWVREETVAAMSTSADLFVYAALVYILWPSRAPRFFEVCILSTISVVVD
jgi:hypothetical protein